MNVLLLSFQLTFPLENEVKMWQPWPVSLNEGFLDIPTDLDWIPILNKYGKLHAFIRAKKAFSVCQLSR